jgi:CTP:phosphocholine cytidylyltransferase-like protein
MSTHKSIRVMVSLSIMLLLTLGIAIAPASALISQHVLNWNWTSDTLSKSVAAGDVNGDNQVEVVTGGYFTDITLHFNAFVSVMSGSTLNPLTTLTWIWGSDTQVTSVAVGDVTGDSKSEIVAGGTFFDNTRWNAFVAVLDGTTLAPLSVLTWYWVGDTEVSSVALGNVTGDIKSEVVVGGAFNDNTRWNAFDAVLNGNNLAPLSVLTWFWNSNTYVNSVAIGNVTGDGNPEVVVGGDFFDNTRDNSFIAVQNSVTLSPLYSLTWYWTSNTYVNSVAIGDVNADNRAEVVIGGSFFDNTHDNAFASILNGATLSPLNVQTWLWASNTYVNSVALGSYSGGSGLDIITAGTFNDGTRNNAFLVDWNGLNLSVLSSTTWYVTSDTNAYSVGVANFGTGNRIIVGGCYWDLTRTNAQVSIWG